MHDNWKILCVVLRQMLLDWPVAFLERLTFRKVVIYAILFLVFFALLHVGVPDASIFAIDSATYDIAVAILLATARGYVRILMQVTVRFARSMVRAGWHGARRVFHRVRARRTPSRERGKSSDEDGTGISLAPALA